jgi:hypothetical protein
VLAAKGCPASARTGTGTDHAATVSADETWTAAGSPHRVASSITLEATVTIEPCAVVLLGANAGISAGNSPKPGKIVAHGAVDTAADGTVSARPITFDALDATMPWGQIAVDTTGTIDFAVVAIAHGGDVVSGQPGALRVIGVAGGSNDGVVTVSTKLDRVLIEASAGIGLNLDAWGALTADSDNLWVRNGGSDKLPYAIKIEPGVAGSLPAHVTATGNKKNEILMQTSKTFTRDDTLKNVGIPYHQVGPLYLNPSADGPFTTLTIEAGVTLAFETSSGSGMRVGSTATRQGKLVAVGTAASPILFTSGNAQKAAGDWQSLSFAHYPSGNQISYAKIEFAGGASGTNGFGCGGGTNNDDAVFIEGQGMNDVGPDSVFIDHTTFENIAGHEVITSGWTGDGPNFSTGNTFGAGTPACHVSQPHKAGGGDFCASRLNVCW